MQSISQMEREAKRPRQVGNFKQKSGHPHHDKANRSSSSSSSSPSSFAASSSPFQPFRALMDEKTDKKERIIKLSREITIQSKRLIFLVHRVSGQDIFEEIIREAHEKKNEIITSLFKQVAPELKGQNYYRYYKHITNGLQEFAESVLFLEYVENGRVLTKDEFDQLFIVKTEDEEAACLLIPSDEDYLLGVADMTGELMKLSINFVARGEQERAFLILNTLRAIQEGIKSLSLGGSGGLNELKKKMATLHASLEKVEKVCYEIKVRGSEYPNDMLLQFFNQGGLNDGNPQEDYDD